MTNFPILDLVAGMIFFYFLLSIISSSAVEMILTGLKCRAKMLEGWLTTIFSEKVKLAGGVEVPLSQAIMNHCSLTALSAKDKSTPYIAAGNFTTALLEQVSFDPANPASVPQKIDDYITAIQNSTALSTELKRSFLGFAVEAKAAAALPAKAATELDLFRSKLENWFDSNMDRVGGKMKTKYTRPFTFLVAAAVALILNADSLTMARYLYNNPEARSKIAASAYQAAHNDNFKRQVDSTIKAHPDAQNAVGPTMQQLQDTIATRWKEMSTAKAALDENSVPLGWSVNEWKGSDCIPLFMLTKFIGLAFTFFAIIMGAPFWFQLLNKIADLRGTGKKPAVSKKAKK
jgi:hypothetical protein